MNRRNFIIGLGAATVGKASMSRMAEAMKFNNPPLVHKHNHSVADIILTSDNTLEYTIPNISGGELLLTINEYGNPSNVYRKFTKDIANGSIEVTKAPNNTILCCTLYHRRDNDLQYLGESLPLYINGSALDTKPVESLPLGNYEHNNYTRLVKRGRYMIKRGGVTTAEFEYPVSQQLFNMKGRLVGYGTAHNKSISSEFCNQIAQRIEDQYEYDSEYELINYIGKCLQTIKWKSDLETKQKYEYIRHPVRTMTNLYGDCKDGTMAICGLLSGLGYNTSVLFAVSHMLSGVSKDSINANTKRKIRENSEAVEYEGANHTYYSIGSTRETHEVGERSGRRVFAIYDDYYQLIDAKVVVDHSIETSGKILQFKTSNQ